VLTLSRAHRPSSLIKVAHSEEWRCLQGGLTALTRKDERCTAADRAAHNGSCQPPKVARAFQPSDLLGQESPRGRGGRFRDHLQHGAERSRCALILRSVDEQQGPFS